MTVTTENLVSRLESLEKYPQREINGIEEFEDLIRQFVPQNDYFEFFFESYIKVIGSGTNEDGEFYTEIDATHHICIFDVGTIRELEEIFRITYHIDEKRFSFDFDDEDVLDKILVDQIEAMILHNRE